MTELKNDRYLRALLRQPVDVTPVWMMRQLGIFAQRHKIARLGARGFIFRYPHRARRDGFRALF